MNMFTANPATPELRRPTAIFPGYMSGFGNGFETEALPGALPVARNSPQKCPYGLYAEQLSGSPFTAPRKTNERSWLYRIRPTVAHWSDFQKMDARLWRTAPAREVDMPIAPLRWDPLPMTLESLSFIEGMRSMTTAGTPERRQAWVPTSIWRRARWSTNTSTMRMARCWSCRRMGGCASVWNLALSMLSPARLS